MASTLIVGDGPGGLSAALFLAKNGHDVEICGQDKTAMHAALLENYLGIESILGSDFQAIARKQVERFGARLRDARIEAVEATSTGFRATLAGGEVLEADYLVLSEGKNPKLAKSLGIEADEDGAIPVDIHNRTSVERVYVLGRAARPGRSQAIISAGDGASAAIDILSREQGEPYCDWDSP